MLNPRPYSGAHPANPMPIGRPSFLPPGVMPIALILLLTGGTGPNLSLALMSIAVLIAGAALLWRPGEAPILLFMFGYQWMQASSGIFHANWLDLPVAEHSPFGGAPELATQLTLVALLVQAAGLRLGAGAWSWQHGAVARHNAQLLPIETWFRLYASAWLIGFVALTFIWVVPGLSQPILALANLKWAFFFMLAFAAFVRGQPGHILLVTAFVFELASSIGGFFSDFKTVLFVTLLALVASGLRVSAGGLIRAGTLAGMILGLGIVWTAIKGDYRSYVTSGEAVQTVSGDYTSRMLKIVDLVTSLDGAALANGADQLLRRLSYTELFGAVLDYVPQFTPHEDGAIWWDAVSRPFMPRMFFPGKAIIDDSARTSMYTGGLSGTSEGTSISLGHVAESYIDFAEYGMMVPMLLAGLFYGWLYRRLHDWPQANGLLGMGMSTTILLGAAYLENSITKSFGGVIVSILVAWLVIAFAVPRWCPWIVPQRTR